MSFLRDRPIKLAYWNSEKRYVSSYKRRLETLISDLGFRQFTELETLADPDLKSFDLLIFSADHIEPRGFISWVSSMARKFQTGPLVWVPAIGIVDLPVSQQKEFAALAYRWNWYIDIISPHHLDSIPIRLANFLRIHDHLRELRSYSMELDRLQTQIRNIERDLAGDNDR